MPGFSFIDNPNFPRHKEAAFQIRDYITSGINSNQDVFEMNQRNYARYRRYGANFDPRDFQAPHDGQRLDSDATQGLKR